MATLTITDESTIGQTLCATSIELPDEQITVEELIRSYVFQRVKDFNVKRAEAPSPTPLVAPIQDEITLNGVTQADSNLRDWRAEFEKTKQAFRNRLVLVFVNDQQVDSLDAVVGIGPSTDVKFMRLTMLAGG